MHASSWGTCSRKGVTGLRSLGFAVSLSLELLERKVLKLGGLVPVPTYFTLGKYALPKSVQEKMIATGGEVTDNLVFLGKQQLLWGNMS